MKNFQFRYHEPSVPEVLRGERLYDGEDDVVDAGYHLQEDVVAEPERVPVRHRWVKITILDLDLQGHHSIF